MIDTILQLGDLLLHIVFYSKIGAEKNQFTFQEVIDGICEKLIHRHPHIYGDVKVENEEEAIEALLQLLRDCVAFEDVSCFGIYKLKDVQNA